MSKVKRYFLSLDEELDFDVVGITSHQPDYKLVWNINSSLALHLKKDGKDLLIYNEKKDLELEFPFYFFEHQLYRVGYFLMKNKNELDYLVPEAPTIDYFLFLTNNHIINVDELTNHLRGVESILGAFIFDNQKFKSFQYLEFN